MGGGGRKWGWRRKVGEGGAGGACGEAGEVGRVWQADKVSIVMQPAPTSARAEIMDRHALEARLARRWELFELKYRCLWGVGLFPGAP